MRHQLNWSNWLTYWKFNWIKNMVTFVSKLLSKDKLPYDTKGTRVSTVFPRFCFIFNHFREVTCLHLDNKCPKKCKTPKVFFIQTWHLKYSNQINNVCNSLVVVAARWHVEWAKSFFLTIQLHKMQKSTRVVIVALPHSKCSLSSNYVIFIHKLRIILKRKINWTTVAY